MNYILTEEEFKAVRESAPDRKQIVESAKMRITQFELEASKALGLIPSGRIGYSDFEPVIIGLRDAIFKLRKSIDEL